METKSLEQSGNLFTFENTPCVCLVDTVHDENGNAISSFKVKASNNKEPYLYAYAPVNGLVMINKKTGSVIDEMNPMEDFLGINLKNPNELKDYIEKYGFFMPLSAEGFAEIDFSALHKILIHFKIVVRLLSELNAKSISYDKLFKETFALIFDRPQSITINSTKGELRSCLHLFTQYWFQPDQIEEINNYVDTQTGDPYQDYYYFPDTFTRSEKHLCYVDYHEYTDVDNAFGYEPSQTRIDISKLVYFYKNAFPADMLTRNIIDFLFHLNEEVVKIEAIFSNGIIRLKDDISIDSLDKFTDNYKEFLRKITKQVIKEEFDFALYSIHPTYNIETMSPGWEIPDLFTALFFSLFYMRPEYEIYRQCANPNCTRLFRVKTTNSRQMYHSPACQNAAAQMRHRLKNK